MNFVLLSIVLLTASSAFTECPTITVVGPSSVTNPGEKMTFRAEIGTAGPKLEYRWSVSAGTIVEGQGTAEIGVAIDGSMEGTNVSARVEVLGLPPVCPSTASGIGPVAMLPIREPIDKWRDNMLNADERRARLDNVFFHLAQNPHWTALVVLSVGPDERLDGRNKRIRFILHHARVRRFDKSRIWFAFERGPLTETVLWSFSPDVTDRPCDGCLIIKGGDIR